MNTKVVHMQPRELIGLLGVLLVGLILRLIEVAQPFVDAWSWRQADVAMIAENFYRHGFNILYPQINWAGNAPGYVGTEFPLIPYIAAWLYVFFGVQDWIGRSVSVLFFAVSIPVLYLLVKKISNESSALFAIGIYTLTPLSIFASRSFMPDMASLSASIMALYFFMEWLNQESNSKLFVAMSVASSLAVLIKLTSIIIWFPLLYLAWAQYGVRFVLMPKIWVFAAISLVGPVAWYTHAYVISISHFPYHFFGSGGIAIEHLDWYRGVLQQTITSSLTPIVSALMLAGIMLQPRVKFGKLFHWWLIAMVLFVFVVGQGNRHQWYQLPIVPIAAAFAGLGCDVAMRRIATLTRSYSVAVLSCGVLFAALAYLSYLSVTPLYEHQRPALWHTGSVLNRATAPHALVVVADDGDPRAIYYSRRQGWHFLQEGRLTGYPVDTQQAIALLDQLRRQGAHYLAFPADTLSWFSRYAGFEEYLDTYYRRLPNTDGSIIFDLTCVQTT